MDTIILAGGKGTRLQEVVSDVPKPLAPINNKPFLDLIIEKLLKDKKISKIILSVGYKKELIISYYKKNNIIFSEENSPLGTGGAVKKAFSLTSTKEILVLNGDTLVAFSISDFLHFHKKKSSDITILYKNEKNIDRYGCLNINKHSQKIISFNEKTKRSEGNINAGAYIFNKNIFNDFKIPSVFSLEVDFFPKIIEQKNIYGFQVHSSFLDIGTKQSYFQAQKILK